MRTSVRRGLSALAIAGGFTLLGVATAGAATADESPPPSTSGQDGVGSGNQTGIGLTLPVDASDNQVTVVGDGNRSSTDDGGSAAGSGSTADGGTTSGEDGVGSGNQTGVDVQAPVDASGNQVTVVGDGNQSSTDDGASAGGSETTADGGTTTGEDGTGSGNQTTVEACAPVDASGNQVTVIGDGNESTDSGSAPECDSGSGAGSTTGEDGTGSGNQTTVDACAPVDASGNQVTVIGDGNQSSDSGAGPSCDSGSGSGSDSTSGEDGTLSGNQSLVGAEAPVDASGNQVTVIGDGNTQESSGGSGGGAAGEGGDSTSGEDGAGSGNQTDADVLAPVDASGNQVTVIGDGNTQESSGGSGGGAAGEGGDSTSGEDGTGSGNQTDADVLAPVDLSGNQLTVIGDGNSSDEGDGGDGNGAGDGDGSGDGAGSGDGDNGAGPDDGAEDPTAAGEQAESDDGIGPGGDAAGMPAGPLTASAPTEVAAGLVPAVVAAAPGAIPAAAPAGLLLAALVSGWLLMRRRRRSS